MTINNGDNIILSAVGHGYNSAMQQIQQLKVNGYYVLLHMTHLVQNKEMTVL